MNRLRATFEQLRRSHRKALIPFVMGGDPNLSMTPQLLLALEDAGADILEVGIPFSDPLADGPVIQGASARALAHGTTPSRVLAAVASIQHRLHVPVVCLSYWNPMLQFGNQHADPDQSSAFLRAAHQSGVAGVIVPDLPIEEGMDFRNEAAKKQVSAVFLAAPTSPPERLRTIARASEGFIYYVSVTGTTGVRRALPPQLARGLRQLRLLTTKPVCVGFGISSPSQARAVAQIADGVIVGSALIKLIAESKGHTAMLRNASGFLKRLKRAIA